MRKPRTITLNASLLMRLFLAIPVMRVSTMTLLAQPDRGPVILVREQSVQHDTTRLKLSIALAFSYRAANQNDSLYKHVHDGLQLARRWPSPDQLSDLHYLLAMYYRNVGLARKGIQPVKLALHYATLAGNTSKIAKYAYAVAVLLADANDLSGALKQAESNIATLHHQSQQPSLASNYLLIRSIAAAMNNRSLEAYYTTAYLNLIRPSWPVDYRYDAHFLKGELLKNEGRLKAAEYQYRLSLKCARQMGDHDLIIDVLRKLAHIRYLQTNYRASIRLLNEAYDLARSWHYQTNLAAVMRELSIMYLAIGRLDQAERFGKESIRIDRQEHRMIGIIESLTNLVTILELKGNYREALQRYRELQQLKEKRYTEKNTQQLTQMRARFEAETKEKTIKILQKNEQISRLRAARQQQQISIDQRTKLAGALIIGLFILLTGIIYYFLRKSRRDFAALTQQQALLLETSQALEKSNTLLSESNRLKDQLFSLISHDLRSPLASIKNNIGLLSASYKHPDELPALVLRLDKHVDTVLGLLSNLLDWSMIQLTGLPPQLQPVDLGDVVEETASQASELIQQKKQTIINQVDSSMMVMTNEHQLQAVIRNLLVNAIKFTPVGGYIRLSSRKQDEYVELQIRDSGIGMTDLQLAKLSGTPEVRSGTLGEKGTGLGLRICREMVDIQGGSLFIESRPGQGTTVQIRLKAA